jgi:hypothetical protein
MSMPQFLRELYPFEEAIRRLGLQKLLANSVSASELNQLPAPVRGRSFFSAGVERADVLSTFKSLVGRLVEPEGAAPGASMNVATAREQIREMLGRIGYKPPAGKEGTIQDLSSERRINLVLNQNADHLRGYGDFLQGQGDAVLDQWPAQELFRAIQTKVQRPWLVRWAREGGRTFGGRMIALKTDDVWYRISRLGDPYPPFDYNSGMRVRDVDRDEAEELGLIKPGQILRARTAPLNKTLQASVEGMDPQLIQEVMKVHAGDVKLEGSTLKWIGAGS